MTWPRTVVGRDLAIDHIADANGTVRVVLEVPTWDDFVDVGIGELVPCVRPYPQAARRLEEMIDSLLAAAPEPRRASLLDTKRTLELA